MTYRRWLRGVFGAIVVGAGIAACSSSTPSGTAPPADAGSCVDGSSVAALESLDTGLCGFCAQELCGALIATCGADCSCDPLAAQAATCLGGLGSAPASANVTSCLVPLASSTEGVAGDLAACLPQCAGACTDGGGGKDAGNDSSSPVDSGNDAPSDAGTDAPSDGGTDAPSDASEDAPTEAEAADASDAEVDAPVDAAADAPVDATSE